MAPTWAVPGLLMTTSEKLKEKPFGLIQHRHSIIKKMEKFEPVFLLRKSTF